MDTKWKRSKKIRAFLIRMITVGILAAFLFSLVTGYPAMMLYNSNKQIIDGDIYALEEFQQYVGDVYNKGLLAFAGVGDDRGYPLSEDSSNLIKENATIDFFDEMAKNNGDLIFYMYDSGYQEVDGEYGNPIHTNTQLPLISDMDGYLNLTEDLRFIIYLNGPKNEVKSHGYFDTAYLKHSYMPNVEKIGDIQFVMAMKKDMTGGGPLQVYQETAKRYQRNLIQIFILAIAYVICCMLCLFTHRPMKEAREDFVKIGKQVLFECKIIVLICCAIKILSYIKVPLTLISIKDVWIIFGIGVILYPILLDLKENSETIYQCSIPALCYRAFINYRDQKTGQKAFSMLISVFTAISLVVYGYGIYKVMKYAKEMEAKELNLVVILFVISIILLLIIKWILNVYVNEVTTITKKISDLHKGDINVKLLPGKQLYFKETAEELNQLEDGIESAVRQKSQSDKMRVELITNVSHDLKTPLTSIINYADLLCEEELPATAKEYAFSLREKSYKLKSMVQDVFELSKASSGNLAVELQVLDIGKLILQTVADMQEQIDASTLSFKNIIPEKEELFILGDGEKLYRTFQNLYVNAIQYSLENSRVYTIVEKKEKTICIQIKSTSKWELNIDTDEIVERFVRADESRSTEGSGLGLSIGKSFVEACGGIFNVSTNADMFIVEMEFPVAEREQILEDS